MQCLGHLFFSWQLLTGLEPMIRAYAAKRRIDRRLAIKKSKSYRPTAPHPPAYRRESGIHPSLSLWVLDDDMLEYSHDWPVRLTVLSSLLASHEDDASWLNSPFVGEDFM